MNVDELQLVNRNKTSMIIFQLLAGSAPVSNETNVESFKTFLKKRGFEINEDDYYKAFDDLEDVKVGNFDATQPSKFVWKYNLKDVSEQIVYPNKRVDIRESERAPRRQIIPERTDMTPTPNRPQATKPPMPTKRPPGRPPGAKNKPKAAPATTPALQSARPKAQASRRPSIVGKQVLPNADVIFFFKTRRGKLISLTLEDADDLVSQVSEMRAELTG